MPDGTPAGAKPRRVPAVAAGTCAPGAVSHATPSCPGQHISCDCDYPRIIAILYTALIGIANSIDSRRRQIRFLRGAKTELILLLIYVNILK